MNVELFKYIEKLAGSLRFYENILQDDALKDQHKTAQICKEALTPVYYDLKEILQSSGEKAK